MNGGGLFETGAGGSAPRHIEQSIQENHLYLDSPGEFLALVPPFEQISEGFNLPKAKILATLSPPSKSTVTTESRIPTSRPPNSSELSP
jgi:isocitrate dehydrogenase